MSATSLFGVAILAVVGLLEHTMMKNQGD